MRNIATSKARARAKLTGKTQTKQLTAKRLREVLSYSKTTGVFRWRFRVSPQCPAGSVAGCGPNKQGYIVIRVDGVLYLAQRLAWLYVTGKWPKHQVDHKRPAEKTNNSWRNLREATDAQQQRNKSTGKIKWVTQKPSGKWQARLSFHFGSFDTAEQAHKAAARRAKKLHGEFFNAGLASHV